MLSTGKRDRPRPDRGLLVSPDVARELSGLDERGVKPPLVRLPGKTALSAVLLSANPWEQRDLVKRLHQIQKEKTRKARSLEWTQRQFFVNQVFDSDLNLRFSKLLAGKSAGASRSSNMKSSGCSRGEGVKLPSIKRHPLRIFATPMPQNRPRGQKRKRKCRIEGHMNSFRAVALPQLETHFKLDESGDNIDCKETYPRENTGDHQRPHSVDSGVVEPTRERSQSAGEGVVCHDNARVKPDDGDDTGLAIERPVTSEQDTGDSCRVRNTLQYDGDTDGRASNASTASISEDISDDDADDSEHLQQKPPSSHASEDTAYGDLCKPKVITRLTRTLPATLMLKANQNINKVIFERKRTMLQKSKSASLKNTFVDPRWESLQSSLVTENQSLKFYSE